MAPAEALKRMTLEQAITANKALTATAKRYREDAAKETTNATTRRILIDRAKDCEHVASVLVSGASIT